MANCEELKELLEIEVIPDIEEVIDELFEQIAKAKKADDATKGEYARLQELRSAFLALLHDLEEGDVSEDECAEIFSELEEMIEASQENESV